MYRQPIGFADALAKASRSSNGHAKRAVTDTPEEQLSRLSNA
jgi:hypothetical protein